MENEQKKYEQDTETYLKILAEMDEDEKEEYIAGGYEPSPPLQAWTWSFANLPLEPCEKHEQVAKFDTTTLTKIVAEHLDPIPSQGIAVDHASLVQQVQKIVDAEYDKAEMAIENHPVLYLMCGVLCLNNSRWLSKSDSKKFQDAHDTYSVDGVIYKQVEILQEMVYKNQTGNGHDSRDYDTAGGILVDNYKTVGVSTTAADDPVRRKRKHHESGLP